MNQEAEVVSLMGSVRPNPFTTNVRFRWHQPQDGRATVRILDLGGRKVFEQFADGNAGWHELEWDGRLRGTPAPSGVYFLRVDLGKKSWRTRLVRMSN